jgi:hypothetical protein
MTQILFPGEPYQNQQIDTSFEGEAEAAIESGFAAVPSIDFEALTEEENALAAIRRITAAETATLALYRGWMLTPAQYTRLYAALSAKNLFLINSPEEYRFCHYLPENYPVIAASTPKTVSLPVGDGFQLESIFPLLKDFGDRPLIVKDYVKSQKHYWTEACFIPAASDLVAVQRVVSRFLELQGDALAEGLVFREFVELKPLGIHPKSGMPLTREFRCFFLDGTLIATGRYWDEADYGQTDTDPPSDLFQDVVSQVQSRFFTMDIAQNQNGEWLIVELGDGQVSGLPESLNIAAFYRCLRHKIESERS